MGNRMFLCRYRFFDQADKRSRDHLVQEIVERAIYFQDPKLLNDPYECFPQFDIGKTQAELSRTRRYLEDHVPARKLKESKMSAKRYVDTVLSLMRHKGSVRMSQDYREVLTSRGICCFSADARSILMWAHYANGHKGICLIYEMDDELVRRRFLGEVIYSDEPAVVKLYEYDPEKNVDPHPEWGDKSLRTKFSKWRYEQEWRLFSKKIGALSGENLEGVRLHSVIRGAAMDDDAKRELREIIQQNPIPVRDATLDQSRYQVNIRNIPL